MNRGRPKFKVIVAGGRNFNNYELLKECMNKALREIQKTHDIEIVSGTANGADTLGEQYAQDFLYPVKRFPADWKSHGRAAGIKRNTQMAEYADALVAFWDGVSRGTKNMIGQAKEHKLQVQVVYY